MVLAEEMQMSGNYAILTDENKAVVDKFIDFLAARQKIREQELLELIDECERGDAVGPFHSVEELMADLYA